VQPLNLGILAHVDAGKTTLTERLLYTAGVITELGSVDKGTTQTDTLALERQRGITIKTAVVSFDLGDTTINLIDTPGHPDFISEVERALTVLDGAVLVISAVEGVQPQTRLIMRALQRLSVPTVLFVNKLDRVGADLARTVAQVRARLTDRTVLMGAAAGLGTRAATFDAYGGDDPELRDELALAVAADGDGGLGGLLDRATIASLRAGLAARVADVAAHPVYGGSALTGAGCAGLLAGLVELLPRAPTDADGPATGRVFKIERTRSGEKVCYVRLLRGTLRVRDHVALGEHGVRPVAAIEVFGNGTSTRRPAATAGQIARVWGLGPAQVGDVVGGDGAGAAPFRFAPPTLEAAVVPRRARDGVALRQALGQLAEQDPLIDVRLDDAGALVVSLYGEVQKEVLAATLADDYGLDVAFAEASVVCVERPRRDGVARALLRDPANPYSATVGLRVAPAAPGSGVAFDVAFDSRLAPLHIYKTHEAFAEAIGGFVARTLELGLYGWAVTDCTVTMTECDYYTGDGPAPPGGKGATSAADFRRLTPLVLRAALRRAGTVVCEPHLLARAELPVTALSATLGFVARLHGVVESSTTHGETATLAVRLAAADVQALHRQLPDLTGGEGFVETTFADYRPVRGRPPVRGAPTGDGTVTAGGSRAARVPR
jgi:ribosomal protection tetracycline resistance protein